MILRAIKTNLKQFQRSIIPTSTLRNAAEIAHHNVDRESLIKSIQLAYHVSVWEAEAQIDAAESRAKKMRKAASLSTRAADFSKNLSS